MVSAFLINLFILSHRYSLDFVGIIKIELRTDSEQVIKGATDWRIMWEQNGFKDFYDREVVNRDYYEAFYKAEEGLDVKYVSLPSKGSSRGSC
jgi:ribonuclease HI